MKISLKKTFLTLFFFLFLFLEHQFCHFHSTRKRDIQRIHGNDTGKAYDIK